MDKKQLQEISDFLDDTIQKEKEKQIKQKMILEQLSEKYSIESIEEAEQFKKELTEEKNLLIEQREQEEQSLLEDLKILGISL